MKSGDIYVKISKTGRLVILMANEVWINYKFPELNLQNLLLGQKKKLCRIIHRKFKEKGIRNIASYTKDMVRTVLVEAMVEYYKQ